jgi:CHAD domain-containing protein
MELFTDFYGKEYQNYLNEIKAIQTILGDIQDSVVLTDVLKNILEDKLEKIMPAFNQILRDNRYQKWQDWRQLQIKFLGNNYRQNLRNVILINL